MKTVYIKGVKKFKKNIRKGLERKSKLVEGIDFIEGLSTADYSLFWIREDLSLRDFKLAISAKYVWKNRLKFYFSIEDLNPKKEDVEYVLTTRDFEIINEIQSGKRKFEVLEN